MMINFRDYRYNVPEEEHYLDIPNCIWCSNYIGNQVIRLNKIIEREGEEISVKYRLPFCSNKCYHDDPNGLKLMDHFIKDSEDWRKKYLDNEAKARQRRNEERKEEEKRRIEREKEEKREKGKAIRGQITWIAVILVVALLGYLMEIGIIPEIK